MRGLVISIKPTHMSKTLQESSMKMLTAIVLFAVMQLALVPVFAQSSVRGSVTSGDDGAALPGVNVVVKGTTAGATTDQAGSFNVNVPNADAVLVFSFIGYKSKEVTVGAQTIINVVLDVDTERLSEIIVVGYGETKKESLTSAISAVKGKEFVKSPHLNL